MSKIADFAEKVISRINKRITDMVFLEIQGDRELMQEYLGLIEKEGISTVNKLIGKTVKKQYQLTDADGREDAPESTLIRSHQTFD